MKKSLKMTNEQLIKKRWKYTDELLKQYEKKFKTIFTDIKDELIELFNELDIKREDLTKTVPSTLKRKLDRKIREWKKDGLLIGYFKYLVSTTTRFTYQNVLNLFVYGIYMKYQKQEFDEAKDLLVSVANDVYKQAKEEVTRVPEDVPKKITWNEVNDWVTIQTLNLPVYDYLLLLTQTAQEEAYKLLLNTISQELTLDDSGISKLIEKQQHRLIYINEEKSSGMLENASVQAGNKAYYEPFKNELCRFLAEMDDRTTPMCRSLNNKLFNTKDRNIFERYSDLFKGMVRYDFNGLIEGINLPPIGDHFHWCRSTITYDINWKGNEYVAEYVQMKSLIGNYIPDTIEEYVERVLSDPNYREHAKTLEALKKHFDNTYVMNAGRFQNKETRKMLEHMSFDNYQSGYFSAKNDLVGIETSNGIVVNDISLHFWDRMIERKIDVNSIIDDLKNGKISFYQKDSDIINFEDMNIKVGLSIDGNLTTCVRKK